MKFYKFFTFSSTEMIIIPGVIVLSLVFYHIFDILNTAIIPDLENRGSVLTTLQENAKRIDESLSQSETVAQVVTALFWATVGALVYIPIWLAGSFYRDVRNQIEGSTRYHHPQSFHASTYWAAVATRRIFMASIVIVMVWYGIVFFQILLPTLTSYILSGMQWNTKLLMESLLGVLALTFCIHIFVVLLRLLLLRPRLYS